MNITTNVVESVALVHLEGNLDTNTADLAEQTLNELIDSGTTKILVNLARVAFVSSAGLRVLLATAKRLRRTDGDLRISNLNEMVNQVFEISGFTAILSVFPTEEAALEGF
ncbi:MAG TPA: STAS domain-containing protein [Vicinamibacteria bacterium]|nr:STAS domain-containing protein [Vicinamibacteria bacterium]